MRDAYRVYIDGNGYGFGNIGDDAILQGIIKILKESPSISEITVGVKDGKKLPFLDQDITVAQSFNSGTARQMISNSDCLIVGGGTMIGDELGLEFPLAYNAERILYSEKNHKKVVLFGVGANELRKLCGRELAKILINHSGLITVRDQESLNVCTSLSRNPGAIFQTSDPAFLLEPEETERTREIKEQIRSKGKTIGINVVNEAWAGKKKYKAAIAAACSALSREYHMVPFFISNEIRPGTYYDYEANRETASLMDCENIILEPAYYSPEEMIDIISAFDIFFSMRMHGLIFASLASVPFATISRIDKVENLMRQFGREPSATIDDVTPESLLEDLLMVMKRREEIIDTMKKTVIKNRADCWKNKQLLNEYVRKELKNGALEKFFLAFDTLKYNFCIQ